MLAKSPTPLRGHKPLPGQTCRGPGGRNCPSATGGFLPNRRARRPIRYVSCPILPMVPGLRTGRRPRESTVPVTAEGDSIDDQGAFVRDHAGRGRAEFPRRTGRSSARRAGQDGQEPGKSCEFSSWHPPCFVSVDCDGGRPPGFLRGPRFFERSGRRLRTSRTPPGSDGAAPSRTHSIRASKGERSW